MGGNKRDPGQHVTTYPAVLAALSVGTNSILREGASGGVAAWIHTFL